MKRSKMVAVFVLVPALLGGGAALLPCGHAAAPTARTAAAAQGAPAAQSQAAQALSRVGWEAGAQYVQSLEYHVVLGQDSEQAQPGQAMDLRASGELRSVVSEVSAEQLKVRYELRSAKLEARVTSPAAAQGLKATEQALARPFGVKYDVHGRALELLVEPGLDNVALGLVRELVATLQLSLPAAREARWGALESDPAGEYRADYCQLTASTLQRQKREYVRISGRDGLRPAGKTGPRIRVALAQFRLDDWGRATDVESHSEIATPPALDGGGPLFLATTDLKAHFVSRGMQALDAGSLAGLQLTSLTPDARDFARAASDSDRALVGNATPRELLSELDRLAPEDNMAASNVQGRLSALVRQQPGAVAPLLSQLNAKNAPTILGALGSAGTPEAQKALADVTRDPGRETGVRQAAVDSMLMLEHPSHDVPEALQAAMRSDDPSLRTNSSLMLGAVSQRMAEDEPEKAAAVNQKLASDLDGATDTSDRLRLLGSLGNSGASEGLPQIAQSLKSPDPAVRAQAASALRFVKDAQADVLLSQVIAADPAMMVRAAALGAAAFRSYDPLAGALEGAAKDPEASLRLQLVSTLASLAAEGGGALLLLDRIAQSDPNKDVQAQAKLVLERAGAVAQK